ncbi:ribonuclease P protein component [Oxalobacteraceae bacterium OM1]|nr:ribonuclease P protein component [Oxalobacteraceae bacterium OM1]
MHAAPKAASAWLSKPRLASPAAGVTADYSRDRRIVKTDEFSSVFRLRPVQRSAHFVLYARSNALDHARLGVVAAKRFAPRAVTRNTIKRVARELFRQMTLPALDCIVRLSKPVNTKAGPATSTPLKAQLRVELQRLLQSQAARRPVPNPGPGETP